MCAGHTARTLAVQTLMATESGMGTWARRATLLGDYGRVSLRERTLQPRGCEFAASDPDHRAAARRALYSAPDETHADQPSGLGPSFRPRWEAIASSIICKGLRPLPMNVSLSHDSHGPIVSPPSFLHCSHVPASQLSEERAVGTQAARCHVFASRPREKIASRCDLRATCESCESLKPDT